MCARNFCPPDSVSAGSSTILVDQAIAISEARPTDHITITGRHTLDVFLGLCRRGFLNATFRTAAEAPHTSADLADALWVLETENAAELRTTIARCARDLRPQGTLLVSLETDTGAEAALVVGAVLIRCGFRPVRRLIASGRILLLCERQGAANTALAA